jgi:serine/threonine-protein phosphatase PGAM5
VKIAIRRVLFVRHGQYDESGSGRITPLGQAQARATGEALLDLRVDGMVSSTLVRARETADLMAASFPGIRVARSSLLCECLPTALPSSLRIPVTPAQIRADRARADKAYERFIRPSRKSRTDVIVCHGNIIRYFACRVLDANPRTWIRMQSLHCGITEVAVLPSGDARLSSYNDTGHLPRSMRTMSNAARKQD